MKGNESMFAYILDMVLTVAVGSVKNPANVSQTEWTLMEQVYAALGQLLAKKPANFQ